MGNPKSFFFVLLFLLLSSSCSGQSATAKSLPVEPALPVIDYNACPFEGCTFQDWLVTRDSTIFTSWKVDRKPYSSVKKGEVVKGLTGVHITFSPDRVRIFQPIAELHLQPGDVVLRYMYHGEGYADLWINGEWKNDIDSTFIQEKSYAGCLNDCPAKVETEGKKEWWVRIRTAKGTIGWAKAEDQFDCIDVFGGDEQCDKLNTSKP